jgi:hypothetical protein
LRGEAKVVGLRDGHVLLHVRNQANDVEVILLGFFIDDTVAGEGPDHVVIGAFRQFSSNSGLLDLQSDPSRL